MLDKPNKMHAALLGGLIIGTISGIPGLSLLNCCCCAGILLGGVFSVYFYKKEFTNDMSVMESSDALILGIIAGIVGAVVASVIGSIIVALFGSVEEKLIMEFFDRFVSKMEARGALPADSFDQMRDEFERSLTESQTLSGMLKNLFFTLIIYPIFSMLGGLIGFGLFGRKKPQSSPPMRG
jgi:hypothetical protein